MRVWFAVTVSEPAFTVSEPVRRSERTGFKVENPSSTSPNDARHARHARAKLAIRDVARLLHMAGDYNMHTPGAGRAFPSARLVVATQL
jgi:hypothetical protein